jgi:hypothetical protein
VAIGGHGRRADRLGEDAGLQGALADGHRQLRVADDERDDLRRGALGREALAGQLGAQDVGVGGELVDHLGMFLEDFERRQRRRDRRRRQGGREDQRARAVGEVVAHRRAAGGERAVGPERLPQRADDDVDDAVQTRLGHGAAPVRPQAAGPVRLVHDDPQAVALGKAYKFLQRRDVAVHREHAVGDDDPRPPAVLLEPPREMLDVAVVVDEGLGARQPAAVDQRGVVELVGVDDSAVARQPRQRADHAEVRQVSRAEQHRRLGALERRQRLLQPPVHGHRPGHQPGRAGTRAPAHRRVGRGLAHARVVGEPEVVVGAQQQDRPAVDHDARPLRARHVAHPPVQAGLPQLLQAGFDVAHDAAAQCPNGMPDSCAASSGLSAAAGQRLGAPSGRGGTVSFLA